MPSVSRIDFGYFIRPGAETETGKPRVEGVLGYVIEHSAGLLLFDTGLGEGDAEVDAHYRPVRRGLPDAMRAAGFAVDDVRWVANCHLHFDHCGGNPALVGHPIFVQSRELQQARTAWTTRYRTSSTSAVPRIASSMVRQRSCPMFSYFQPQGIPTATRRS
jgi:N-acyl homoserine lactone hydrolase